MKTIFCCLLAIIVFLQIPILTLGIEVQKNIYRLLLIIIVVCFFLKKEIRLTINYKALFLYILSCVFIVVLSISNESIIYIGISYFLIFLFIQLDTNIVIKTTLIFKNIYVYSISISFIVYLLYLFFNLTPTSILNSTGIKFDSGVEFKNYYNVLIVTGYRHLSTDLLRFQFVFEEPGIVGTLSGLLLIAMNKTLTKKERMILSISGFATLSTAFFVFYSVYIIMRYSIFSTVKVLFVIICSFYLLYFIFQQSEYLSDVSNLIIMKYNSFGGTRNSECFLRAFDESNQIQYLFGHGYGATAKLNCDVSSFLIQWYDYGLFGLFCILFSMALIFAAIYYQTRKISLISYKYVILWGGLLVLNLYQRPDYFFLPYYLLGMYFIINLSNNINYKKK